MVITNSYCLSILLTLHACTPWPCHLIACIKVMGHTLSNFHSLTCNHSIWNIWVRYGNHFQCHVFFIKFWSTQPRMNQICCGFWCFIDLGLAKRFVFFYFKYQLGDTTCQTKVNLGFVDQYVPFQRFMYANYNIMLYMTATLATPLIILCSWASFGNIV